MRYLKNTKQPTNKTTYTQHSREYKKEALKMAAQMGVTKAAKQLYLHESQLYNRFLMCPLLIDSAAIFAKYFSGLLLEKSSHIQYADCPGRSQPGTGKIDFKNIFATITALNYAGWVGAKYNPTSNTANSLGWLTRT